MPKHKTKQRKVQDVLDTYILNTVLLCSPDCTKEEIADFFLLERNYLYTKLAEAGFDWYSFEYEAYRRHSPDLAELKTRLINGRTKAELKLAIETMEAKKGASRVARIRRQYLRREKPNL